MEHFYQKIDGFMNCDEFYRRTVAEAKNGSIFVEIGVWKGKSTAFMAVEIINSGKKIEFYAVDHFKGSPEHQNNLSVKENMLKDECYKNLEPVMKHINMLPIPSIEAAKTFADNSVDFIYIDGAHEYDDVKADILAWWPKVKVGGIISGDDYGIGNHPDVQKAVDEIFPSAKKEGVVWSYEK